jgi:hypothetical protein
MHDGGAAASQSNQSSLLERVTSHWDQIRRRLSEARIQRRHGLPLRQRSKVDVSNLPRDLCRLQFARWLVESGKLSEEEER